MYEQKLELKKQKHCDKLMTGKKYNYYKIILIKEGSRITALNGAYVYPFTVCLSEFSEFEFECGRVWGGNERGQRKCMI